MSEVPLYRGTSLIEKPLCRGTGPLRVEETLKFDLTAPGYSTRSRTNTAFPAGTANAEEKCKICFKDPEREENDQKRPYLRDRKAGILSFLCFH